MAKHEIQESILSTDEDSLISKPEPKLSVKGVAFGLMASALGTGLFNLPLRVTQIGILPFIVYVLLSAAFSIKGANMLA
jgi:amino acid permease